MCAVGSSSQASIGADAPAGTLLAGSIGGGAGAGVAGMLRRRGTLLGGTQTGTGSPAPTPGGGGGNDPRRVVQQF